MRKGRSFTGTLHYALQLLTPGVAHTPKLAGLLAQRSQIAWPENPSPMPGTVPSENLARQMRQVNAGRRSCTRGRREAFASFLVATRGGTKMVRRFHGMTQSRVRGRAQ